MNMPLVIVGAFLVLTLLVGVYFSRKKTTFREYAVGNKQFSTATLVATVLATTFGGGGLIRNVEQVYKQGLYWIPLMLSTILGYWVFSRLVLRMGPFMHHLSIAESIGSIYGRLPRIITALSSISRAIVGVAVQVIVMSKAIGICVDAVNPQTVTIFATLILIFYSAFGGVRAVTFTDVFQLVTFTIVIPILAWLMFQVIDKPILDFIPFLQSQKQFQLSNLFQFDKKIMAMFSLCIACLIPFDVSATMQRAYMSSDPIQARRVFSYATLFSFCISSIIHLIGVLVLIGMGSSNSPTSVVWGYVMQHIPSWFSGFVAISLLAMSMSTADSHLNSCSVMINHDILGVLRKSPLNQMWIVRSISCFLGISAMVVALFCNDLLVLFSSKFDFSIPIISAPFLLAIYGFRGTTRTALIGMASGILTTLVWKKWVEPTYGINGAFIAMLANIIAMMIAHYLLKQPESAGWVGPDDTLKQIQQEKARKWLERKEAIKNSWANRKITLAKLVPSHTTMIYVGFYTAITILLSYFMVPSIHNVYWIMLQLLLAACLIGYPFLYDMLKEIRAIPSWCIGLCWLMVLVLYLPLSLLGGDWWKLADPIFNLSLFLTDSVLILLVLPLYLGIVTIATTSLLVIYKIFFIGLSFSLLSSILPLFIAILLIFAMTIVFKVKIGSYINQNIYLKGQEGIRESKQLKAALYDEILVPSNGSTPPKGYGVVLNQAVRKVEESISFLDNHTPMFKEDFQSIINKFYDWVFFFNKKEKAKDHALLQPNKISLNKLMRKVEVALSQEVKNPPRLLVKKITDSNQEPCTYIICDIHQVVYLLVKAILRVGRLDGPTSIVSIQLHPTVLQFKQADAIDNGCPTFMGFQATAMVVSQSTTASENLPKVKAVYNDTIDTTDYQWKKGAPPSMDLEQDTISTMVRAHYGYLEASVDQHQPTMLLVLPNDVTDIRGKMTVELPLDSLTLDAPVTPKEQADSMMALMQFHDHICKSSCKEDPIDIKVISGLILLLRQYFRFKRHASGKLFYVRAVGIAEIVTDFVFHSPKVIYAALLYELVRRTCLLLSYIKEHYNLGVYAFVSNVVKIDKRQELDDFSLLCVKNRLEKAIKEDHVQLSVLFIKLAERLYDLRHAAGYIHLTEVQHMAQETLAIDIPIANAYLDAEIGQALEAAAKQALRVCKSKEEEREKGKNKNKDS